MKLLVMLLAVWAVTGLYFVLRSPSRGAVADVLFGVLWPIYWYTDWRRGLWRASFRGTLILLYPAIVTSIVALIATAA